MSNLERAFNGIGRELPSESNFERGRRLVRRARITGQVVVLLTLVALVGVIWGQLERMQERAALAVQTYAQRHLDTTDCPQPVAGAVNQYAFFFVLDAQGRILRRECAQLTGPRRGFKPSKGIAS